MTMHDSGMGYRKIAYWLNEHGYTTPRGHEFKNTHVFSILKKERVRDERLNKCYKFEIENLRICRVNATKKLIKMIKIRLAEETDLDSIPKVIEIAFSDEENKVIMNLVQELSRETTSP